MGTWTAPFSFTAVKTFFLNHECGFSFPNCKERERAEEGEEVVHALLWSLITKSAESRYKQVSVTGNLQHWLVISTGTESSHMSFYQHWVKPHIVFSDWQWVLVRSSFVSSVIWLLPLFQGLWYLKFTAQSTSSKLLDMNVPFCLEEDGWQISYG